MRTVVLSVILLLCTVSSLPAQYFNVATIDPSGFPILKAGFYAFDAGGRQARPSPSEIEVIEDGIPRTVLSVTCPPVHVPAILSMAMSLDISGSMTYGGRDDVPIDLGKTTLRMLMDHITSPASEFAFQTCDDQAVIRRDFTTDRESIRSTVDATQARMYNDFVEQLLDPFAGILNVAKTGKYKRVAVLYTDAWWPALPGEWLQRCIDTCAKYQIEFYAIIYTRPEAEPDGIKSSLRSLAAATGGGFYDGVTSHAAAREIALRLQKEAESTAPCQITWKSSNSCSPLARDVRFRWKSVEATAPYPVTDAMLGELRFSPPFVYLRPTGIGERVDTTITVMAINSACAVSSITSSHPAFAIAPQSFTLAAGESRTLTVSYTPQESAYSWTRFDIMSDVCSYSYNASGRFSGTGPEKRTLQLEQPNGGEELVVGSDTLVSWNGIPQSDTVRLHYSMDDGATWKLISSATAGPRYRWQVPGTPSRSCRVRVTQLVSGKDMTLTLHGHTGGLNAIAWSSDGTMVATAGDDNSARIWDADYGQLLVTLEGHTGRVMNLSWSIDGSRLATASLDHTARVWDVAGGAVLHTLYSGGVDRWNVSWSPDGQRIATGGELTGKVWDAGSGALLNTLGARGDAMDLVAWSSDGSHLVTSDLIGNGGSDSAGVWDMNTGSIVHMLAGRAAVWSPDGNMIATISDRVVFIWNARNGVLARTLTGHTNRVISAVWNPDTRSIATASTDNTVRIWNIANGTTTTKFQGDADRIGGVAWSPDGRMIATPGITRVRIWDPATGEQIESLDGHTDRILDFAWSPDGNRMASASIDQTARLWQIGPAEMQCDSSDALFSIVMPSPTARDIDMGITLVNTPKDTLVPIFVGNGGSYPFNVSSIDIIGADASQFTLESGRPPYSVAAGGGHPAEFRFRPTSVGVKSATLRIITQADTLLRTIRGEGIAPQLQVVGRLIDFGQMEIGLARDTVLPVAIRNIGSMPVNFTGTALIGPDDEPFSILYGGGAFTLAPGESRVVALRFSPRFIGRASGRIGFAYDGLGSPATITLFGRGIGGLVYLPHDSAAPGSRIMLPLRLEGKVTGGGLQSSLNRYRTTISYNTTLLSIDTTVSKRSINAGRESATFDGQWNGGADLGLVPFRTGLGNSESTDITIEKFQWLDDDDAPLDIDVDRRSGGFRLLEICRDGGARLLNPSGHVELKMRGANPAAGSAEIEIELLEEGETALEVIDIHGRQVAALKGDALAPGIQIVTLDTRSLAVGTYFVVLQTPTVRRTLRLEVRR